MMEERERKLTAVLQMLLAGQLILGCQRMPATPPATPSVAPVASPFPSLPPETSLPPTTKHIDATTGGTLQVTNPADPAAGTRLTIPPNALENDITLSISTAVESTLTLPGIVVIDIEPDLTFRTPATLELRYSDELLNQYGLQDESELSIVSIDEATGIWEALPDTTVDAERKVVSAQITHLSHWSVVFKIWRTVNQRRNLTQQFVPGERNVLVLHGFRGSPTDACMQELVGALHNQYDNVGTFQYPSARSIPANAEWLRDEIERQFPNGNFDIVAYSEGGLVARSLIEQFVYQHRVDNLVTIGTPHEGIEFGRAMLLYLGPLLLTVGNPIPDQALRRMFPAVYEQLVGSPFLVKQSRDYQPGRTIYHTIAGADQPNGNSDGLVTTASAHGTSTLQPVSRETIYNISHSPNAGAASTILPCDQRVYDALKRMLPAGTPSTPSLTPPAPTVTPPAPVDSFPGAITLSCAPDAPFSNLITLTASIPARLNASFHFILISKSGPIDRILGPSEQKLVVFTTPGQSTSTSTGDQAKCGEPGACSATYEIVEAGYGTDALTSPLGETVTCEF